MAMSARRQGEIARREREILDCALELFGAETWASVTMDQIAAASDVSKGTLYNHFASKDDIYARLLIDFSRDVLQRLEQAAGAVQPAVQLRDILATLWDAYRDNPHYRRISYYCEREGFRGGLSASVLADLERLDRSALQLLAGVLQRGADGGRLRATPAAERLIGLRFVLAGMSRVIWNTAVAPARDDPQFKALAAFVLAGLGADHE